MHRFSTRFRKLSPPSFRRGISIVEMIVGIAIFSVAVILLYQTYVRVFDLVKLSRARVVAVLLAAEQFEVARNLPYADVGTVAGIPFGKLTPVAQYVRDGFTFIATTTVRNIDFSFDGTAGGSPNDLSPADNKLVQIDIDCVTCKNFRPLRLGTNIGPKSLEGSSTNGSLFVKALDAGGLPLVGASVHIHNPTTTPVVDINDITGAGGMLQIIDAPPASLSYEITVSKSGYSSERTYGAPTTTNPVKPHATVAVQTVTQLSFAIDRLAHTIFSTVTPSCAVVPDVGIQLTGSKLISTSPNTPKFDQWLSSGASGVVSRDDIEWDSYALAASSSAYDLAGVSTLSPFSVAPGETKNIQVIMRPRNPNAVLVTVHDSSGLPIADATVALDPGGSPIIQTTGRGFLRQTDWSGGSGQDDWTDQTKYASQDGNVDVSGTPGVALLDKVFGDYRSSGVLESSTFDTGSASNFYQITYLPTGQPVETADSVRLQIATANSTSSLWTYLGPDGTASTYYNSTTTDIAAANNGKRFLRYALNLSTASTSLTPTVSDVQFTFTSACVPPGQVLFQGLSTGTYTLTISKTGYTPYSGVVTVNAGTPWQETQVTLAP